MSNEWKMVPVEPTQEMLSSVDCNIDGLDPDGAKAQWDALLAAAPLLPSENFAAPGILINPTGYKVEHQAAPVPPAGDVEVVAEIGDLGFGRPWVRPIIDNPSLLPPMGTELVDRAHVTRLTAELDAERREHAETERISQQEELRANNYATQLVNAQSELTKVLEELRLEKVAGAAMHKQAEDFKALSWERGQELTKARELLDKLERAGLRTKAQGIEVREYLANPIACNVDESCGQDAPAANAVNGLTDDEWQDRDDQDRQELEREE